jgi:hypothetical protein
MMTSTSPIYNLGFARRYRRGSTMPRTKRKRRRITLPVLGAAGMSLAMAGGTSATAPTANVLSQDTGSRPVITLGEEEISDVSLATFYVFDKENESQLGQGLQLAARGGCGGCAARGCGGCAARGCGGCAARACGGCGGARACRGCAAVRGCRGCGGCGCGGCGSGGWGSAGWGSCWVWTPLGWSVVC